MLRSPSARPAPRAVTARLVAWLVAAGAVSGALAAAPARSADPPSSPSPVQDSARSAPVAGAVSEGLARPTNRDLPPMDVRIENCGSVLRSYWRDPDGTLMAADELELAPDGSLARYRYWLPPIAEHVSIVREGRRARVFLRQGTVEKSRELAVPAGVHVGPMLIMRARDVANGVGTPGVVPLLVADRFLVLDFEIHAPGVQPRQPSARDLAIRASSALVRRFVDPLQIAFDADGEVARLRGRALPGTGAPGRKEPIDVDLVMTRHYAAPCSPARLAEAPR